jgi:hypothetical protein
MIRTWKMVVLPAVLAVAVAAVPARATEGPPAADVDKVKEIINRLDGLNESLEKSFKSIETDIKALRSENRSMAAKALDAVARIGKLEEQVAQLRKEVDELRHPGTGGSSPNVSLRAYAGDLGELRSTLARLEQQLARMQADSVRIARSSPAPAGHVLLVNRYPEDVQFVVNNTLYRVPSFTSQRFDLPPGSFTYEILSPTRGVIRPRLTTAVGDGETVELGVR